MTYKGCIFSFFFLCLNFCILSNGIKFISGIVEVLFFCGCWFCNEIVAVIILTDLDLIMFDCLIHRVPGWLACEPHYFCGIIRNRAFYMGQFLEYCSVVLSMQEKLFTYDFFLGNIPKIYPTLCSAFSECVEYGSWVWPQIMFAHQSPLGTGVLLCSIMAFNKASDFAVVWTLDCHRVLFSVASLSESADWCHIDQKAKKSASRS